MKLHKSIIQNSMKLTCIGKLKTNTQLCPASIPRVVWAHRLVDFLNYEEFSGHPDGGLG